jgi:3-dehydroquinate synthase
MTRTFSQVDTNAPVAPAAATQTLTRVQRFSVAYEFPVVFTAGLFSPDNPVLAETLCRLEPDRCHRCLVFIDDGVLAARPGLIREILAYADRHRARMTLAADPIPVPGGEKIKVELHFVEDMQRKLFEHGIDRHSFVIAIGGGAVLDAVGLVAATAHRGVRHIRIPTTVLAQNDSGVGVKNGVNVFETKNFAGSFAPPFAVLNDIEFLDTLLPRDRISGMAEAVKVALIRDAEFFGWLERQADALVLFERPAVAYMIRRCAELHMHQIGHGGDPFEFGSVRPLDFGHWSAHKIESLTKYHVRHGEAVAIGMALDARYSVLAGHLERGQEERIAATLEHLGFRLWHPVLDKRDATGKLAVVEGLEEFRQHLGGELTLTVLTDIGVGVEIHAMDDHLVEQSIAWLKARADDLGPAS